VIPSVTHVCCPVCRLRFTPAMAAYLPACPECGESGYATSLEGTVGFRLFTVEDVPHSVPQAAVVSIPIPRPRGERS
jgi:hypothetical protein